MYRICFGAVMKRDSLHLILGMESLDHKRGAGIAVQVILYDKAMNLNQRRKHR